MPTRMTSAPLLVALAACVSLLVKGQSPDSSSTALSAAAPPPPSTASDSDSNSDAVLTIVLVSILVAFAAATAVAIRVTNAKKKEKKAAAEEHLGEKKRLTSPLVVPYEFASYQKDARRLLGNAVPSDYATSNAVSGAMHMPPLRPPRPDAPYALL